MKEIWINLELYFQSYDFYKFEGFFPDFSDFIFDLKELKTIKKGQKGIFFARVPRGCDVEGKATWQSHAGPRGAIFVYLYLYSL